jgi:hypothetical protein
MGLELDAVYIDGEGRGTGLARLAGDINEQAAAMVRLQAVRCRQKRGARFWPVRQFIEGVMPSTGRYGRFCGYGDDLGAQRFGDSFQRQVGGLDLIARKWRQGRFEGPTDAMTGQTPETSNLPQGISVP